MVELLGDIFFFEGDRIYSFNFFYIYSFLFVILEMFGSFFF